MPYGLMKYTKATAAMKHPKRMKGIARSVAGCVASRNKSRNEKFIDIVVFVENRAQK